MARTSRMFAPGDLLTAEEGRALEVAKHDLARQLERTRDPHRQAELAQQLASLEREWSEHRTGGRERRSREKRPNGRR